MGYRPRPDRRVLNPFVPYTARAVVTPTAVVAGGEITLSFPTPMNLVDPDQLAALNGCYDASNGDVHQFDSITQPGAVNEIVVTVPFNIETSGGVIWFRFDQTGLLAQDGRVVDPTPLTFLP